MTYYTPLAKNQPQSASRIHHGACHLILAQWPSGKTSKSVDDSEQQSALEPQRDAAQRMMAGPEASIRVSRKPMIKSLRLEVIIPRRYSPALSNHNSLINGDRLAELGSHAISRKSSAN